MNHTLAAPQMEVTSSAIMDRFRDHVQKTTGISLQASKASMIHQRLRRRVAECGFQTTDAYLNFLMSAEADRDDMIHAVDLITTNTTSFFREPQHFDFLTNRVVPELLAKPTRPRLKIWSAASSEGAEAYTAAIVLAEEQRKGRAFDYAILGTDISTRIIDKANQAIFLTDQLSAMEPGLRQRYFMQSNDPAFAGRARVVPELRRKVRFAHLNLMKDSYPIDMDVSVVLLRNVLIYFERDDQLKVIDRVTRHIAKGGYLMVGHSESMIVQTPSLRQVIPAVFQKV